MRLYLSLVVILVCLMNLKAESTGDLDSLIAEVETLRQEMAEELSTRDKEIAALKERLTEDAASAAAASEVEDSKLDVILSQLNILKNELELEKAKGKGTKKQIDALHVGIVSQEQEVNQIAFSVYSEETFGPVTVDTNIPFPLVHTNIGNAWQEHINSFQASVAGFYVFSASILGPAGDISRVAIVRTTPTGTHIVTSLYSPRDAPTADANIIILGVNIGDYVSVKLLSDGSGSLSSSPDRIYSTFSGFFLYPLTDSE